MIRFIDCRLFITMFKGYRQRHYPGIKDKTFTNSNFTNLHAYRNKSIPFECFGLKAFEIMSLKNRIRQRRHEYAILWDIIEKFLFQKRALSVLLAS